MAFRPHWSAESLGEITTTSTSYSDLVTLTLAAADQVAGGVYAVFWNAQGAIGQATSDYRVRLSVDASTFVTSNNEAQEISTPQDYDTQGGIYIFTAHAVTPVDAVFKIQLASESAGQTSRAKNGRICALLLGTNDKHDTETARVTTTSTTYQNTGCAVTFTPPSTGDYIIIGTALLDNGTAATGDTRMRLTDGTNNSLITSAGFRFVKDTTARQSAMVIWRRNSVAASPITYTLQFNSNAGDGSTAGISEMRLMVLRVDDFDNVYYAEQAANSNGTDASYLTTVDQTFTPVANNHLTLAAWRFWGVTNNTESVYAQYDDGGTVVVEAIREPALVSATMPGLAARIASYAASSRTQAIQRKSETTGQETFVSAGSAIVTFDLGASSNDYTLVADAGSFSVTGAAATLRASRTLVAAAGSYAVAGAAATLHPARKIIALSAPFAVTGAAASLLATRTMAAEAGVYAVDGADAILLKARTLVADAAAFAVSGASAAVAASRNLAAEAGSCSVAGADAALNKSILFIADAGAFAVSGAAATLRTTRILVADAGSYAVAGGAATLTRGRRLAADAGAFLFTGADAALKAARLLAGGQGAYAATGQAADLRKTYSLTAEAGTFAVSGQAAALVVSRRLDAAVAAYTVAGADADLDYSGAVMVISPECMITPRPRRRMVTPAGPVRMITPAARRRIISVSYHG